MISVDGSLFIQIANFLILIFILNIVLYRPIRKILIDRKEKINGLEQGIDAFHKDAQDKEEAFAMGIKDARADGLAKKDALVAEAAEEERQIIGEINERAQAELAEIKAKVAQDAEAVLASLKSQVDDFAKAIGEKILGRAI